MDDHSYDHPKDAPWMILPGHLNRLLEVVPPSQVLIIDLRSPTDYERSHIHGAINFRAPASFVLRATVDLIEKAFTSEASRSMFNTWSECRCVVFYDKHIEFSWEAPTAEALYRKFRARAWNGQCFVLKGHYREFSASFDKYIVGTKMTDAAREYLLSLQEKSYEKTVSYRTRSWFPSITFIDIGKKQDYQRYDEWLKQLEDEDMHYTDLVPTVKAERMEAMVRHQKEVEEGFESQQPSLYRKALALDPDQPQGERWDVMGPMVAPLSRSIAKMHDAGMGTEPSKADATGDSKTMGHLTYREYSQDMRSTATPTPTPPSTCIDDYDLLESDEEQLANERVSEKSKAESRETIPTDDISVEKKQARLYGGRGLFGKIIRSGRPDGSR